MRPRAAGALLVAGLAVGAAACGSLSRSVAGYEARPGPYDRLQQVLPQEVAEVQRLRDAGRLETAVAWVRRLAAREPGHLPLARLEQDVVLEAGGAAAGAELREAARARLEAAPEDVLALLLAARLEIDADRARAQLERARALAPENAWTHYALAHLEADQGRWGDAAARLERALLVDPGHLWARRLQTQLLSRGGPRDEAIAELERWLAEAPASPFFRRAELDAARLDLAHELVLDGRPEAAAEVLERLEPGTRDRARAHLLAAAIHQAGLRPEQALEAAVEAARAEPGEPLALVQQAMLSEEWLGDPQAARRQWEAVLELASQRADLGSLLLGLRARAALERLDGAAVPADPAGAPAP